MEETTTGTSSSTVHIFWIDWKGQQLKMEWVDGIEPFCQPDEHEIAVMHHNQPKDEDNLRGAWVHYCPTQMLYCLNCFATGTEPEPYECTRWGE